jgi:hypothetical protein
MVIGAPLYEEFLFRKLLIPALKNRGIGNVPAILLSSLSFALVHSPYNLINGNVSFTISHFIATFIVGVTASIAYIKTGDFLMPFLIHLLFNLTGTLSNLLLEFPDSIELTLLIALFVFGTIILGIIFTIYNLIQYFQRKQTIFYPINQVKSEPDIKVGVVFFFILFLGIITTFTLLEGVILNFQGDLGRIIIITTFEILTVGIIFLLAKKVLPLPIPIDTSLPHLD